MDDFGLMYLDEITRLVECNRNGELTDTEALNSISKILRDYSTDIAALPVKDGK